MQTNIYFEHYNLLSNNKIDKIERFLSHSMIPTVGGHVIPREKDSYRVISSKYRTKCGSITGENSLA